VSVLDTGVEDVVVVDLNGLDSFIDRAFKALLHMQQIAHVVRTVILDNDDNNDDDNNNDDNNDGDNDQCKKNKRNVTNQPH